MNSTLADVLDWLKTGRGFDPGDWGCMFCDLPRYPGKHGRRMKPDPECSGDNSEKRFLADLQKGLEEDGILDAFVQKHQKYLSFATRLRFRADNGCVHAFWIRQWIEEEFK